MSSFSLWTSPFSSPKMGPSTPSTLSLTTPHHSNSLDPITPLTVHALKNPITDINDITWKLEWEPLSEQEVEHRRKLEEHFGDKLNVISKNMITQFIRGYSREIDPVATSIEKLEKAITWRQEYGVDRILHETNPDYDELRSLWPAENHGQDIDGRLVFYERIGQMDPSIVLKRFDFTFIKRAHVRVVEKIRVLKELYSEKTGRPTFKTVFILDLEGLGMKHASSDLFNDVKSMLEIDQYFYPESVHRFFIINAPFVFKVIWAAVKKWLHPLTQQKIHILGSDYQCDLLEMIDPEQLPEFLGGTCKCNDDKCPKVAQNKMLDDYIARTLVEK